MLLKEFGLICLLGYFEEFICLFHGFITRGITIYQGKFSQVPNNYTSPNDLDPPSHLNQNHTNGLWMPRRTIPTPN